MRAFKEHLKRPVERLDGLWDFTFIGPLPDPAMLQPDAVHFNDKMPVPSAWDAYPAYAGKRGTAVYRTFLDIPPGCAAFLRFRGTGMWNRVFVDGLPLRTFSLPYSQVEIAIPPSASARRELIVINDNRFDAKRVPLQNNAYDFYAYGGIFRSVELHVVPDVFIKRVEFIAPDAMTGQVDTTLVFGGVETGELPVTITADGCMVLQTSLAVTGGKARVSFQVPAARAWTAETPHLHSIQIETPDDDLCRRIGFRAITTRAGRLYINAKEAKLLGYCRHEAHPQFGPALSLQQKVQDLQILKDLGCNFIRGSHYAQDPEFLSLCDELGFYVFEEALGWGNRGPELEDPAFCSSQLEQVRLMIETSFNNPCVIMRGYLNEGGSNMPYGVPLYRELYKCSKTLDPTRPVTYATIAPLQDLCYDFCDIIGVNYYPGWYADNVEEPRPLHEINHTIDVILAHIHTSGHGDKPFLLTEIGAGAIYGWRDALNAHWTEDYQADCLEIICERVVSDERISGVSLWQFCDGRTYSSSRALARPRAFNNKGTLDEYRRPKLAYQIVKQKFRKYFEHCD